MAVSAKAGAPSVPVVASTPAPLLCGETALGTLPCGESISTDGVGLATGTGVGVAVGAGTGVVVGAGTGVTSGAGCSPRPICGR
jgi:hypothetical protein